jgi:hypothetical protein
MFSTFETFYPEMLTLKAEFRNMPSMFLTLLKSHLDISELKVVFSTNKLLMSVIRLTHHVPILPYFLRVGQSKLICYNSPLRYNFYTAVLNSEEGSRTSSPSAFLGKQYGMTIALGLSVGVDDAGD